MLKVKDVNRLEKYGYEKDEMSYIKEMKEGAIIVDVYDGTIIICTNESNGSYSKEIPEELYELFAANLVTRV